MGKDLLAVSAKELILSIRNMPVPSDSLGSLPGAQGGQGLDPPQVLCTPVSPKQAQGPWKGHPWTARTPPPSSASALASQMHSPTTAYKQSKFRKAFHSNSLYQSSVGEYQSLVGEQQHHQAGLKQRTNRQVYCLGEKVCQQERRYLLCTLISVLTSSPTLG